MLFILKWSAGKGFWYQLRETDKPTFSITIIVERVRKDVEKCKLDITFLTRSRDRSLYPTFTKVKRFKEMERKHRNHINDVFCLMKLLTNTDI